MFRILQQWVDFATEGRRKAAIAGDQLLVDAFKLCNNSLFGEFFSFKPIQLLEYPIPLCHTA